MALTWYVLRSKPNKEEFFWGQLMAHFIEVYYPSIHAKAVNPHTHKDKPYLPGHLFIRVDLQENPQAYLERMPGSRGLVMDGNVPIEVPDALVAAIRRRVNRINGSSDENIAGLPSDQDLETQEFPTTNYKYIFDGCISGNERVHQLHSVLRGKLLPVELPGVELNL